MSKQKKLLTAVLALVVLALAVFGFTRTNHGKTLKSWLAGKPWIRNGVRTEYYPDGKVRFKQTRRNGKSDGPLTFWYHNGKKQMEVSFSGGERTGRCESWHMNGNRFYTGQFAGGKYDGQWRFFDTNDIQVAEIKCRDGKFWEGTEARYNNDILMITKYKEGKIVSSEKRRD